MYIFVKEFFFFLQITFILSRSPCCAESRMLEMYPTRLSPWSPDQSKGRKSHVCCRWTLFGKLHVYPVIYRTPSKLFFSVREGGGLRGGNRGLVFVFWVVFFLGGGVFKMLGFDFFYNPNVHCISKKINFKLNFFWKMVIFLSSISCMEVVKMK